MLGPAVRSTQEIETKAMLRALNGSGQVLVGIPFLGLLADHIRSRRSAAGRMPPTLR